LIIREGRISQLPSGRTSARLYIHGFNNTEGIIDIMHVNYRVRCLFSGKTSKVCLAKSKETYIKKLTSSPSLPPSERACFECSLHLRCCSDCYTSNDDQHGMRLQYIGL